MDGLKEKKVEVEELTPPLARHILVGVASETYERVVRACTEPGFWQTFTSYEEAPVWTFTQALGAGHVVDVNVYTPSNDPACCWAEAVVFARDAENPEALNEVNCIMGDDDPFSAPWRFELDDGVEYELRFTAR
jgi:hypothetical protein